MQLLLLLKRQVHHVRIERRLVVAHERVLLIVEGVRVEMGLVHAVVVVDGVGVEVILGVV